MDSNYEQCRAFVATLVSVAEQFKEHENIIDQISTTNSVKNVVKFLWDCSSYPQELLIDLHYAMVNGFAFTKILDSLEEIPDEHKGEPIIKICETVCFIDAINSLVKAGPIFANQVTEIIPQRANTRYFFYISTKIIFNDVLEAFKVMDCIPLSHQINNEKNVDVTFVNNAYAETTVYDEYEIQVSFDTSRINIPEIESHIRYILPPHILAATRFPKPIRLAKKLEYYYLHPVINNKFAHKAIKYENANSQTP